MISVLWTLSLHLAVFAVSFVAYLVIMAIRAWIARPRPELSEGGGFELSAFASNPNVFADELLRRVVHPHEQNVVTIELNCMQGRTEMPTASWRTAQVKQLCLFAIIGLTLSQASVAQSGDWAKFQNGGKCFLDAELPTQWSEGENIAWQVDLPGYGQSSPIVIGSTVVVTTTEGDNKDKYHLLAYGLETGEPIWKKQFTNPTPQENTSYVSRAAPTPVADTQAVYAFFEGGLLAAVSLEGEQLWKRDLIAEFGAVSARHGLASSPELSDDSVFVWVERSEDPFLMCLDKKSGKTKWKVAGVGATSWSSLRLVPIDGGDQHLVCSASGKIVGYDPASGSRLWEFDKVSNNTSCTPIPLGEGKFLVGASDGRGGEPGSGAASNGVIQLTQADGKWSADFIWQAKRATASFGSSIVFEDSAFIVNREGVLYELDAKSGKRRSMKRTKAGSIWATPLVAAGKLYLFGRSGMTSVIDLSSGEEIASNPLWTSKPAAEGERSFGGSVLYAAAAKAPHLIIRRGDKLYSIASEKP